MKTFSYLKALWSPFRPFKLKWYCGKTAIGTPYFLPRRAIKDPDKPGYLKFVPRRFGFDVIGLGWKTKWTSTDIRFEWEPGISFVCWKWQIAVLVKAPEPDHYWSAWLYYELHTDKTKSKSERIAQCCNEFSQTYRVSRNGVTERVDYYDVILRKKYRNN